MRIFILAALVIGLLAGCAKNWEPVDPDMISKPDQLMPGPGLLSGEKGSFQLY